MVSKPKLSPALRKASVKDLLSTVPGALFMIKHLELNLITEPGLLPISGTTLSSNSVKTLSRMELASLPRQRLETMIHLILNVRNRWLGSFSRFMVLETSRTTLFNASMLIKLNILTSKQVSRPKMKKGQKLIKLFLKLRIIRSRLLLTSLRRKLLSASRNLRAKLKKKQNLNQNSKLPLML